MGDLGSLSGFPDNFFRGTTELLLHRDKDVPGCRRSRHAFSRRRFRESEKYANLRNEVLGPVVN